MTCVLTWEKRGVVQTFSGFVTADELVTAIQTVWARVDFDELRFIIRDFSAASFVTLDATVVEALVIARVGTRQTNPYIRVAVVGGVQAARFVEMTNEEPLKGTRETLHFLTLERARDWLASQPHLSRQWQRDSGPG